MLLTGLGEYPEEFTDADMPDALYSVASPIVTRRAWRGLSGFFTGENDNKLIRAPGVGINGVGGDDFVPWDFSLELSDYELALLYGTDPLAITVNAWQVDADGWQQAHPNATDAESALNAARHGVDSVTMADGTIVRVISAAAPPANPSVGDWYKVAGQLLRYTGQRNAQGAPIYTATALSAGPSPIMLAALAVAAYLLLG